MPRNVIFYRTSAISRMTPLVAAARNGHLDEVIRMLETGVSVDHQDEYGITSLHMASLHNHPEVVRYLLEHGAKTDVKDAWG